MQRKLIIVGVVALVLLAIGGGVLTWAYYASQRVPAFYEKALAADPAKQRKANDECLKQAADLFSDAQQRGKWQATFTAEQINGWLAVDLVKNYPEFASVQLRDPRVALEKQQATIGGRYTGGSMSTVVSLSFDAYLSGSNTIAVRIRGARAGDLPVPLDQVLEAVTRAAEKVNLTVEWRQADGDPVALVRVDPRDKSGKALQLDSLEMRAGEIFIAGHTGQAKPTATAPSGG